MRTPCSVIADRRCVFGESLCCIRPRHRATIFLVFVSGSEIGPAATVPLCEMQAVPSAKPLSKPAVGGKKKEAGKIKGKVAKKLGKK